MSLQSDHLWSFYGAFLVFFLDIHSKISMGHLLVSDEYEWPVVRKARVSWNNDWDDKNGEPDIEYYDQSIRSNVFVWLVIGRRFSQFYFHGDYLKYQRHFQATNLALNHRYLTCCTQHRLPYLLSLSLLKPDSFYVSPWQLTCQTKWKWPLGVAIGNCLSAA